MKCSACGIVDIKLSGRRVQVYSVDCEPKVIEEELLSDGWIQGREIRRGDGRIFAIWLCGICKYAIKLSRLN